MEFTALFLAVAVVMLVAWRGSRSLALTLFAATLIASYLHQATDTLWHWSWPPRPRHSGCCTSCPAPDARVVA
jgi:hypothetical protein